MLLLLVIYRFISTLISFHRPERVEMQPLQLVNGATTTNKHESQASSEGAVTLVTRLHTYKMEWFQGRKLGNHGCLPSKTCGFTEHSSAGWKCDTLSTVIWQHSWAHRESSSWSNQQRERHSLWQSNAEIQQQWSPLQNDLPLVGFSFPGEYWVIIGDDHPCYWNIALTDSFPRMDQRLIFLGIFLSFEHTPKNIENNHSNPQAHAETV